MMVTLLASLLLVPFLPADPPVEPDAAPTAEVAGAASGPTDSPAEEVPQPAGDGEPNGAVEPAAASPGESGSTAGLARGLNPSGYRYPVGERLVYRAVIDKAGIAAEVGRAVLSVAEERDKILLKATASGESFAYTLDTTITSVLSGRPLRPESNHYEQRGSEPRQKKMLFSEGGATYMKFKHCRDPECKNPEHITEQQRWMGGLIPWGHEQAHCTSRSCTDPAHMTWRQRTQHVFDRPFMDMLTAVYEARGLDFASDDPKDVAVLSDKDRWLVRLHVKSRGTIRVAAGEFDAVEVTLEPQPLERGKLREEFRGLFGMHGSIRLWLDQATNRPLRVRGIVPFGPLDLNATIELIEAEVRAPEAATEETKRSGPGEAQTSSR